MAKTPCRSAIRIPFRLSKSDSSSTSFESTVICRTGGDANTILFNGLNSSERSELLLVELTALAACQRPQ
jgi:hypothetical protein